MLRTRSQTASVRVFTHTTMCQRVGHLRTSALSHWAITTSPFDVFKSDLGVIMTT